MLLLMNRYSARRSEWDTHIGAVGMEEFAAYCVRMTGEMKKSESNQFRSGALHCTAAVHCWSAKLILIADKIIDWLKRTASSAAAAAALWHNEPNIASPFKHFTAFYSSFKLRGNGGQFYYHCVSLCHWMAKCICQNKVISFFQVVFYFMQQQQQ